MINKQEMLKARDEYIELVKKELMGPGSEISIPDSEHELISDAPNTRYSVGILFTKNTKMNADNDDASRVEELDDNVQVDEAEDLSIDTEEGFVKHNHSEADADEDNLDEEIGLATQNMPSSMGITFFVKGNCNQVNCRISFGTYRKALASDCRIPYGDIPDDFDIPAEFQHYIYMDQKEKTLKLTSGGLKGKTVTALKERDLLGGDEYDIISLMYKLSNQLGKGFVREPHYCDVMLNFSNSDYIDQNKKLDDTNAKVTALRRDMGNNIWSLTIMLVNDDEKKSSAKLCLYQPEIRVGTDNNAFTFVEYGADTDFSELNDEEQSLALQYRNKKVYGTGLGTSVSWNVNASGRGEVYSEYFPTSEVPSMDFNLPEDSGVTREALSMKYMSDLVKDNREEKYKKLLSIVEAYDKWINDIERKVEHIDKKYKNIAVKNIDGCKEASKRMHEGIELLKSNEAAWSAFQLANRAMFMQRAHLRLQKTTSDVNRYPYDEQLSELLDKIDYNNIEKILPDPYSWRPFQIAFLLMSIKSIVDDFSRDRELVDLIWFPTGGGKTEAYLGLTAFSIFYRRLEHKNSFGGTTVIMRYTLRLLAAQQFTRASTLICACEYIRVDATNKIPQYGKYDLGAEPITIGLWIGSDHTPNKNDKAKYELKKLETATAEELDWRKDCHNKFQVLKCPWCGTKMVQDKQGNKKIGMWGYRMKNDSHFELLCPQEACFFNSEGKLPIQIVDEELYKNPPTLLFGTVDKFAMLPWNPQIGAFFGIGGSNRAPELIIQDELHLISGPLGTMVGLYEAAIDSICSRKGPKTKIIASTATIRRAAEQCSSLYDRNVCQFPHPGIDVEDSFFARESVINYEKEVYGRKYVGLMPAGKTKAMMEIRSIAALLQKIHVMELPYEIKDQYWTLTVYFNSLRDLGKCSTLVDDDVKDFVKRMAYRVGTARDARLITSADELTSRTSSTRLNEILDKLEKLTYSKERVENKRRPSDILLATNMISVGIDVARLNVMLLIGQPKLTSEYIQASSRVGRAYPGVAFTMYDGSKSRDRSHYEQFVGYHESFYKHVEPTGVTPFSKPARDRALHAIVVAMLRQFIPDLTPENAAGKFSRIKYQKEISAIVQYIVDRNNDIINKVNPGTDTEEQEIKEEIAAFLDGWEKLEDGYGEKHFFYGKKYMIANPEEGDARLMKVYNSNKKDHAFDTMTSMRNVDISVGSSVLIWKDK